MFSVVFSGRRFLALVETHDHAMKTLTYCYLERCIWAGK